ncbi:ABC transporter permease [Oceaniovalibus sp. ACAM 378]|uniref:ABC transporter permease n=1 Tax=Oceaniovalibus sp. ACAM 378 TaxID=2599923 RepID=UPI0011D87A99|nr:ABC transporter permease [Oceaniovalibus sp. ACAM 378]TYB87164.1 ABC transporter permease [Oceaniovalibus sp. ACAM 378]
MNELLDILMSAGLWSSTFRIATPLIFGTLGALLCERAGVLNLGIEGIMTFGAMIGWLTVFHTGDLWLGVAAAAGSGAMFGLLHGLMTVTLGLSQHVTGLGITLFASSLSYYVFRLALPVQGTPPTVEPFANWVVPVLSDLPGIGPALFNQTPLTYLAIACALVLAYVLARTPLGLAIRITGENPHAADAQGLNPLAIRICAIIAGSALMAVGGSFLTLAAFNSFFPTMVQGRGWVCIALVVFSTWRPMRALLGAVLFALFDAWQLRLQTAFGKALPYQLFLMLPYVLSIVALVVMARRARVPQALMKPYRRGER